MRCLGRDASAEFQMIHPPGTLQRHLRFLEQVGWVEEQAWGWRCCRRRR